MIEPGRRRVGWLLAGGLAVAWTALATHNLRPSWAPPPDVPAPRAPTSREPPPGAVVAADGADLARLLGDPSGPAEVWLAPREYRGDFVIRRPLALRGAGRSELVGSGGGTVLTIEADDVTVEELVLRDSGRRHTLEDSAVKATGRGVTLRALRTENTLFGVQLAGCRSCLVEDVLVDGTAGDELRGDGVKIWESDDSVVRRVRVERARDVVVWYSRRVRLEHLVVRHSRYGAHFMHAEDSSTHHGRYLDNDVGIFVMYSSRVVAEGNVLAGARGSAGMGFGFKESETVDLHGNWVVANTTGIYLDNTPRSPGATVRFERNLFALNDVALRTHGANRGIDFADNVLQGNNVAGEVDGGGDMLALRFAGNRWSDYAGYDLDRDGRGDVPYEVKRLSGELTDARPVLRYFRGTVAMGLIDAIAEAVPTFSQRKLLVDLTPSFVASGP
ncbi:MAG: right-handed parallel beta-helix repeat-containing protein [Polyangiaceae bacterium]|nr:right-handed parallel beta-helix repeat-containing protein [Polyangiaceae bacterium]